MNLFDLDIDVELGLSLASRVHRKYRPVFERLPDRDRAALALYFLPHRSQKEVLEVTRPQVVKWYCPFADQRTFPSGHRYCINVYTGCQHKCQYCYASGYIASQPGCKNTFRADLIKDLDALDAYDVLPAPVHMSNSTDAFQPLELEYRHTLYAMERLAERRHRFTTVTLLTKNPVVLTDDRYVEALHRLNRLSADHPRAEWFRQHARPPLRVECSLAFASDESRRLLDLAAASVESRMAAIRFLRDHGIPVLIRPVLIRIDPLFPRDPLPGGKAMGDFDLPDVQPLADLEALIRFTGEVDVDSLVYSIAKITRPRLGGLPPVMEKMKRVYEHLASEQRLVFRGGSWRLPTEVATRFVAEPFLNLCRQHGVTVRMCKANLISTP
jgi:DNA repair photolyase